MGKITGSRAELPRLTSLLSAFSCEQLWASHTLSMPHLNDGLTTAISNLIHAFHQAKANEQTKPTVPTP